MTNHTDVTGAEGTPPPQRGPNAQQVLWVMTTVLGAIGTLYLATGSLAVTAIGAVVAVITAALYLRASEG